MSEEASIENKYIRQYKKLDIYKKYGFCGYKVVLGSWMDTPEKEKEVNEAIQKAIEANKPFKDFAPQWLKDDIEWRRAAIAAGNFI